MAISLRYCLLVGKLLKNQPKRSNLKDTSQKKKRIQIAAFFFLQQKSYLNSFHLTKNTTMKLIISPLEQFQMLPILPVKLGSFDFSITNSNTLLLVGLFLSCFLLNNSITKSKGAYHIMPKHTQILVEGLYEVLLGILKDTVGEEGQRLFPYFFNLFSFIITANVTGLIPYSCTVTSHLIVTFILATMTVLGLSWFCIRKHGGTLLSLILPTGSCGALAILLIPIEAVSFFVRPISLSTRLFVNMMAGHTLIKVLAGFAWSMMLSEGILLSVHFIPLLFLSVVMVLEFVVALIQGYVFILLNCVYLNEALT
jgi:ATP synthase subunit 6